MAARKPAARQSRERVRRQRRTYSDMFLDQLRELSGDPPSIVGNRALRQSLNWNEERYDRIKDQLVAEGLVTRSRGGPGGSVSLVATEDQALKVFVSYSHVDEDLRDALMKHLRPLERMKLITSWSDRKLLAGDDWGEEISRNLEEADLVLLLVSIDFINSEYCYDVELDRALERNSGGECKVIPVILRDCMWQHSPFAKLQALPPGGQPIKSFSDQDQAMAMVAEGIRSLANEILAKQ